MKKILFVMLLVTLIVMAACVRQPEATVTPAPSLADQAVAPTTQPSATPVPQAEPDQTPTRTAVPTPAEVAPDSTFTDVGNVAELSGDHGVQGKAMVAGLQTLIIQGFSFDGKGPEADVRLVLGDAPDQAVHVLLTLEGRPYDNETQILQIPSSVTPGSADSIAVYCSETDEVYAIALFR